MSRWAKRAPRPCVWLLATASAWLLVGVAPVEAREPDGSRLFLNCAATECFEPFLRQQLSSFDLVRDRHQARFEVLIAAQPSGSGGVAYTVTLFTRDVESLVELPGAPHGGRGRATEPLPSASGAKRAAVRKLTRRPGQGAVEFRAELLDAILRALYPAVMGTPEEARFQLTLPPRSGAALGQLADAWDYWVIIPELGADGEGGSGYYTVEVGAGVTIRRITDQHKLRLRVNYWRSLSGFEFEDGSRISGDVHGIETNWVYARSLGEHYALGFLGNIRSSVFENLELHAHYGPVFEVNAFPYTQNAARQLRFVYQLGVWYNNYFETSAFGHLSELRYYHAVSAIADVNQSWGSVQVATQLNSFLRDPSLLRLAFGGQLTLLLFEGLSVQFEGTSAWVKDQINVRQRPLRDNEVLLFTAEQPTRFEVQATIGLTYAFGSVHNTIVNPRFGRVDLNEE